MAKRYAEQIAFSLVFIAGIAIYYAFEGMQYASLAFLLIVSLLWVRSISMRSLTVKDFGLTRKGLGKNMLAGFFVGIVLFIIYNILLLLTGQGMIIPSFGGSILSIIIILFISFGEEFFFRGSLQGSMGGIKEARKIALVSVLFGLYKLAVFREISASFFIWLAGSVVMSLEFEKTRSLITPFMTHLTWNLLVSG